MLTAVPALGVEWSRVGWSVVVAVVVAAAVCSLFCCASCSSTVVGSFNADGSLNAFGD